MTHIVLPSAGRQCRLRGLDRGMFVGRLAYYPGEVNALHPFREGNGRAQRAFSGQLARDAGFTLAWQHLDAVRNVEASAAIMRGGPEPMRKMLDARQGQHLTTRDPSFGAVGGTLGDHLLSRAEPADMALPRISSLRGPD